MKTLHLYLVRQVLATMLMTVAVFTFVLLLGNLLQEVLGLLFSRQATLGAFLEALALLVPFVLVYALPMGLLTAALLTFGRFSADQELTAARAGGVSLVSLVTPLLLLSLALSGVCALINMELAPRSRVAYKRILANVLLAQPSAMLRENTFLQFDRNKNKGTREPASRVIVYVGKISGTNLTDVLVCELDAQGIERRFSRATHGRVIVDRVGNMLRLVLEEAWIYEGDRPFYIAESNVPEFDLPAQADQKLSLNNMTFL